MSNQQLQKNCREKLCRIKVFRTKFGDIRAIVCSYAYGVAHYLVRGCAFIGIDIQTLL